jgi:hypothetical protein
MYAAASNPLTIGKDPCNPAAKRIAVWALDGGDQINGKIAEATLAIQNNSGPGAEITKAGADGLSFFLSITDTKGQGLCINNGAESRLYNISEFFMWLLRRVKLESSTI